MANQDKKIPTPSEVFGPQTIPSPEDVFGEVDVIEPEGDKTPERALNILEANKEKNFVQRVLDPASFPGTTFEGQPASHRMEWGEADGKFIVYPTIIQEDEDNLKQLNTKEAQDHAFKTGEFIEFDTEEEAAWFSSDDGYKAGFPPETDKPSFLQEFFPRSALTPEVAPTPAEEEIVAPGALKQAEEPIFDLTETSRNIAAESSSTEVALNLPPEILNVESSRARREADAAVLEERASQRLTSEIEVPEPTVDQIESEVRTVTNLGGFEDKSYNASLNNYLEYLRTNNPVVYGQMEDISREAPGKVRFDLYRDAVNRGYNELNKDHEILVARGVNDVLGQMEQFVEMFDDLENQISETGGTTEGLAAAQEQAQALQQQWDEFFTPEVQTMMGELQTLQAKNNSLTVQMADLMTDFPKEAQKVKSKEALNTYFQLTKGRSEDRTALNAQQLRQLEEAKGVLKDANINPNLYKFVPVQTQTKAWNTVMDFGLGLIRVAKLPSDAVSKAITGQGEEFTDSDRTVRALENFVDSNLKFNNTIDASAFNESGALNWFAMPAIISEQATRMALMLGAGAGATKVLAKTGIAPGIANLAGITAGGFAAEYRNLMQDALNRGISSQDAVAYAGSAAMTIGILEGVMGVKGFNTGRTFSKAMMPKYVKALADNGGRTWGKQVMREGLKLGSVASGESLEEFIQGRVPEFEGVFMNQAFGLSGERAFETQMDAVAVREEIFIGGLMGGLFGIGGIQSKGQERRGYLTNALQERESFNEAAQKLIDEGTITGDQLAEVTAELDEIQRYLDKIPKNTPQQQKNVAAQKLQERDDLEGQKKDLDSAFQAKLDEQIEQKNKEAADAVAGNRGYYKSVYTEHAASLQESIETAQDETLIPRLQAELDQVNEVLKMVEDGATLKDIRAKAEEVGAPPIGQTELEEEPVTTEVITSGAIEQADVGGKFISGSLNKTGQVYEVDDALLEEENKIIETTQDLDNLTTKTTNEQKAVKVEQTKREGKKPRIGKYQIGNKIYQTKEGFLKDARRMPGGRITETFNFPIEEAAEVTEALNEARANENPFSIEEMMPLFNNAELNEIGQVLDRRTERLDKINKEELTDAIEERKIKEDDQLERERIEEERALDEAERGDQLVEGREVAEEEAEEITPPVEERKKELQQSISDRLGRLGGIRTIVSDENPFKNDDFFKDLVGLVRELAELGTIKLSEGINSVIEHLKGREDLSGIQPRFFDEVANDLATELEVPPPAEVVPEPPVEAPEDRFRRRGVETNTFQAESTPEQRTVKNIVEANPNSYRIVGFEEGLKKATTLIEKNGGFDGAYAMLVQPARKSGEEIDIVQPARLLSLTYYAGIMGDETLPEATKKDAFERIKALEKVLSEDATVSGRANAMLAIWKAYTPEHNMRIILRKTDELNKALLDKPTKHGKTRREALDELAKAVGIKQKEVNEAIADGTLIDKLIGQRKITGQPVARKRKTAAREVIDRQLKYEADRTKRYKESKGKTLQASLVPGLSQEDIEYAGDMLGSYIKRGIYKTVDLIAQLRELFSTNFNIDLTDQDVANALQWKVGGKTIKQIALEEEAKSSAIENLADMGLAIKQIVRMHASEQDQLNRTLAQKFIDEAGLDGNDAAIISKAIEEQMQEAMEPVRKNELAKLVGTSTVPAQQKKNKTIIDKFNEAINLGALKEEFYINLFAEKYGIKQITPQEANRIIELTAALHRASGHGNFERDATIILAKYIYNLYPKSTGKWIAQTWIALNYAQMLSGPTTSVLNLWSAGNNITQKPVRDTVNFSKWLKVIREGRKTGVFDVYNPFGDMFTIPLAQGFIHGKVAAKEVYINGDFDNKYIEGIKSNTGFKVPFLETDKHGKGKAFKPAIINIKGIRVDANILNKAKYVGRNLSGQDKLMFNTAFDIYVAQILRDKILTEELAKGRKPTPKELTKRVKEEITGQALPPEKIEEINARVEAEAAQHEKDFGVKVTDNQKKIRTRELKLAELGLTPLELEEAEQLARSDIFTDDRFGLVARGAAIIGYMANRNEVTGLLIKPFVPFTKIVGNVTEYAFDAIPLWGFARANGFDIVGIANRITNGGYLPKGAKTAALGEKGSRAYYEQMGRAWLGTIAFTVLAALTLGSDEDDFIQITGGFNEEGFRKSGREQVQPKYSLIIGGVPIPYKNIPGLAIPLALIGNMNDRLNQGIPEGDVMERLTVAMALDAALDTMMMAKDESFVQGAEGFIKMIMDVVSGEENRWKKAAKTVTKQYVGYLTRPLPWQNNFINQMEKLFDPISYSQKEIREIVAYSVGIQRFVNQPNVDIFGEKVKTYPGETLMPYTHWAGIKGDDRRWAFLAKFNAIPNKVYNQTMTIEHDKEINGPTKRRLEPEEFFEYTTRAGRNFDEKLRNYISKGTYPERALKVFGEGDEEKTGVQIDVAELWTDAKAKARKTMGIRGGSAKINTKTFRQITEESK